MKTFLLSCLLVALTACSTTAFVPSHHAAAARVDLPQRPAFVTGPVSTSAASATKLSAKYNTMDEILAKFPEDTPVLINFYDANTESEIKNDILRAKQLLEDRAKLVSIKQQDYPELAKLWDCAEKSPSMILFKDGKPVTRLFGETHYLEIVAHMGKFCKAEA